ncbi:hypothetical protein COL516b_001633 [Colletotrichum fioriniae]|nr:uncharacterized protein COL516b_001633 [Colletotrichum fioriniae]KAJ0310933.1 hypothetical protein COL516b_001633 [Colletotrichum fioriniae]
MAQTWKTPITPWYRTWVYFLVACLSRAPGSNGFYATASEHAVMYQYNFHDAASVFAAMIQTEPRYYQPTPNTSAPFASSVGLFSGDPDYSCAAGDEFSGCDELWVVVMRGCEDILIAGAGLYSWFSAYAPRLYRRTAVPEGTSAKYMVVMDGKGIVAKDNLNVNAHSF